METMLSKIKKIMKETSVKERIPLTEKDIDVLAENITENMGWLGEAVFLNTEELKNYPLV